jgi:hypothetical protein
VTNPWFDPGANVKIRSIQIRPTDQLLNIDGVDVRLWRGTTDQGQNCLVLVHCVAIDADQDQTAITETLGPELPPPATITPIITADDDAQEGDR